MLASEFDFYLPDNLIAQYPVENRTDSKLLVNQSLNNTDHKFVDILKFIQPNDVIVRNNTKVIPARLFGKKSTGGKIEMLLERVISNTSIIAMLRSSKTPKIGKTIILDPNIKLEVTGRKDNFFILKLLNHENIIPLLEQYGHIPLPPYIDRNDDPKDKTRYQTVYAKSQGAVAAPTAGLHFDKELFNKIKLLGATITDITLHVGAGTFQPMKVNNIEDHKMHSEWLEITDQQVKQIRQAKDNGGRVIAIGTTSLRALEAASMSGELKPFSGETDIFITPGFKFKTVDLLLTNFHLPKSTLLMLVSAFAGSDNIKKIYQHAISNEYRFFSYGDAMLLTRAQL